MTTAMAGQSWLTHSPKPRDTLPPAPSNFEGELLNLEGEQLNLEGEQPLSQSLNSYSAVNMIRFFIISNKITQSQQ